MALEQHLSATRRLGGRRCTAPPCPPTVAAGAAAAAAEAASPRAGCACWSTRTRRPVRITVSPAGRAGRRPLVLEPFALPGGLGAHKWRDRRLLEALAALRPGAVPLLVDTDGLVLEAAYANVWIVEGDALITPPADGRMLPGTRAPRCSRR